MPKQSRVTVVIDVTYLDDESVAINVTLLVPKGDSCLIRTSRHHGSCHHYRGKACDLFNKVIVDGMKCQLCLEAEA